MAARPRRSTAGSNWRRRESSSRSTPTRSSSRDDRAAGALVRRPADRRGRGQRQGRQPRQPRHALAGGRICHRAEPGAPRAGRVRRDDGRAGRGRRVAARRAGRGRRLSGRYAGGGSGPDHRDPARGLAGRLRYRCGGLDRGARDVPRARQAALPLGVRHAAMPVEAPRRPPHAPSRRAWLWSACRRRGCSRSSSPRSRR